MPDAIASRIIREVITCAFGPRLCGGIEAGIDTILKVTKGEPCRANLRAPGPTTFKARR
jgi:uncharacterized membrane protein YgcG